MTFSKEDRQVSAVSIGQPGQTDYYGQEITAKLDLPFYYHTEGWYDVDKYEIPIDKKLAYRANRRNEAVELLLEKYPLTTDILMIDSFYMKENTAIDNLIRDYFNSKARLVLGPSIWARMRTNLSQLLHSSSRFYDAWSTPELRWCPYGWRPERDILTSQELTPLRGFYKVSSVGGCYIFPREAWEEGSRYGVPFDNHGCEHNYFHSTHHLPVYVDFNVQLWRVKKYSLLKCARCSIGNWTRTH